MMGINVKNNIKPDRFLVLTYRIVMKMKTAIVKHES